MICFTQIKVILLLKVHDTIRLLRVKQTWSMKPLGDGIDALSLLKEEAISPANSR